MSLLVELIKRRVRLEGAELVVMFAQRRRRLERGDDVKKAVGRETLEEVQRGVDGRQEPVGVFKTSTRM